MAARTEDEILTSYQQAVELTDPTADTAKGPLYSLVGRPLATVISPLEQSVDELDQIYSIDFAEEADTDQAQAFITNWGESAGTGVASKGQCTFGTFTRPGTTDVIPIDVGSFVGNSDQSLQYLTTQYGEIRGDQADSYYNAQRRTYEITLPIQAVANGPQYDLPVGRVNTKISALAGIDIVENRADISGGVSAEGTQSQIERTRKKLTGLALNTPSGQYTRLRDYNPSLITDVKAIISTDRKLFRRPVTVPGVDYYLLGSDPQTVTEVYTSAAGGETLIPLQNVPVLSVSMVLINGAAISNYSLIQDTSLATGFSPEANDQLQLSVSLIAGDVVTITLTYDNLFPAVQEQVLTYTQMFKTSELARAFRKVPINISLIGKSLPTYTPQAVANSVAGVLSTIFTPTVWTEEYLPSDVLNQLNSQVKGLTSPSFVKFQRSTQATSLVEAIVLDDNELPQYVEANVTITIKSS
jgi:hypothetical protein